MMFFKSVPDLCFTGLFAVLGKPSTTIDHSAPVEKTGERSQANGRADGRYQTYYFPCFVVDKNKVAKFEPLQHSTEPELGPLVTLVNRGYPWYFKTFLSECFENQPMGELCIDSLYMLGQTQPGTHPGTTSQDLTMG